MPEGHSVHRIALQVRRTFVGQRVATSSPQGRFATGAAELDGREIVASSAVGKHLLVEFEGERTLHVHLGLYGGWDFAGQVNTDPTFSEADGGLGTTCRRGTVIERAAGLRPGALDEAPAALLSVVAEQGPWERFLKRDRPQAKRLRMSESSRTTPGDETGEEDDSQAEFPEPPVGQVRLRLLSKTAVADLRGPTACEIFDPEQVDKLLHKIGPDPMHDTGRKAENRFVERVLKSATPIGLQLMDQSVVAGIGNIYRAELLFRARLNPYAPGKSIPEAALRRLWKDWAHLLAEGVQTGWMITREDITTEDDYRRAMTGFEERNYVYRRAGLKSLRGTGTVVMEDMGGRNLYWVPGWQTCPKG